MRNKDPDRHAGHVTAGSEDTAARVHQHGGAQVMVTTAGERASGSGLLAFSRCADEADANGSCRAGRRRPVHLRRADIFSPCSAWSRASACRG